ncbi:MAG: putative rane protein [Bradyrhizobium sp.]|jgi:putative membrane protein|nr:putative rane protein [Bradyrhizobium sp.]
MKIIFWIGDLAIAFVAGLHIYFMVLEMFLWTKPHGRNKSGYTPKEAEFTAVLAANQGLYNGFLAAGLIWCLIRDVVQVGLLGDPIQPGVGSTFQIKVFFLLCVIVAGVYGAATVPSRKTPTGPNLTILYFQAAPAVLALILVGAWALWR